MKNYVQFGLIFRKIREQINRYHYIETYDE